MQPVLSKREALAFYLIAWFVVGLLLAALLVISGDFSVVQALAVVVPMTLIYAFISLSSWYLCKAFPAQRTPFFQLLFVFMFSGAVASSLWILLGSGWTWVLEQIALLQLPPELSEVEVRLFFGVGVLLYLLVGAANYVMIAFEASRETERRNLELKILAQQAELRALRAQLDPHFLFNCLNSISALATQNPQAARAMSISLADFLRKSLQYGAAEMLTIEEELSLAMNYLEIEQIRFGTRLKVATEISEGSKACLIPSLILQPLIENAVRHGIAHLVDGGSINLRAFNNENRLHISVENPCDPARPRRRNDGLGLANVRARLKNLYDDEARVDTSDTHKCFRVEISLPALKSSVSETETR